MRTIETTVYTFDELSDSAKQKALDADRNRDVDHNWWEWTYEDFISQAALKGYAIEAKDIHFTGFWSQGDGACFSGTVRKTSEETIALLPCDLAAKIKLINSKLRLLGEEPRINDLEQEFKLTTSGRYSHSNTMDISTATYFGQWTRCKPDTCTCCPEWPSLCDELEALYELVDNEFNSVREAVLEEARGLADDLYKSLEQEHKYLTSDEHIAEYLRGEEAEFTEDGRRV